MENIRKLMNLKLAKIAEKPKGENLAQTAPAPPAIVSMFPPINQARRIVLQAP